jgi:hypothetical protein
MLLFLSLPLAGCGEGDLADPAARDDGQLSQQCASAPLWAENVHYARGQQVAYQGRL